MKILKTLIREFELEAVWLLEVGKKSIAELTRELGFRKD